VSDDDSPPLDADALGRLGHDLRTPLTIIAGFADALAGEGELSDAQRREFAARIRAAADELRDLLDRLP
jgi:signal transduction histidine kinase